MEAQGSLGKLVGPKNVVDCPAIGHHKAFKAPFVTQEVLKQLWICAAGFAIDSIVGAHDAPSTGLDTGFEGWSVRSF